MKVIYEWRKRFLRRIEMFTCEDLDKKPEIRPDTAKMPPIPTGGAARINWARITDEKEKKRHHGKGH